MSKAVCFFNGGGLTSEKQQSETSENYFFYKSNETTSENCQNIFQQTVREQGGAHRPKKRFQTQALCPSQKLIQNGTQTYM